MAKEKEINRLFPLICGCIILVFLSGCASVHTAIYTDNTDQALKLIGKSNIAKLEKEGYLVGTPLELAAERGNIAVAEALLDKGVDVNTGEGTDSTALHAAVCGEKVSLEMVKLLLDRGAHVNARSSYESTPLMSACSVSREDMDIDTQTAVVELLLERGADANLVDDYDQTVLYDAATSGKLLKVIDILVARMDDINGIDKFGYTAYESAARYGKGEAAKKLLDAGANPPRIITKMPPEEGVAVDPNEADESFYDTAFCYKYYAEWNKEHNNKAEAISAFETEKEYLQKAIKEYERSTQALMATLPEAERKKTATAWKDASLKTMGLIMYTIGPGMGFVWDSTDDMEVEFTQMDIDRNMKKAEECAEALEQVELDLKELAGGK